MLVLLNETTTMQEKSVLKQPYQLPEIGFMKLPQVLQVIPVSRSTFLNKIKSGEYPAPIKLSERSVAWRVSDVMALVEKLSA
jgi:predicted DNA-binding transcriptional regulator AlpA